MGQVVGRKALVTGGSSGVGRATALLFLAEGAQVAVLSRESDHLRALAAEISGPGKSGHVFPVDVANRPATATAVERAVAALGGLDVVVHAAGINIKQRAMSVLDPADWDRVIEVNLQACFNVTHAVLPTLRKAGGGQIIYISSISAKRPEALSGPSYIAAKSGLNGLAAALTEEERKHGIRPTVVVPGLIDTKLILNRPTPPSREQLDQALRPEDVAKACLFIASQPARVLIRELEITPTFL